MADQGKWFKLWESSLDDQDLENLSIHEWFCWVRFGTYLKKHGKDGKIRLRAPATALTNLLRLPSFKDVITTIRSFPNYVIEEGQNETANVTNAIVTYHVNCSNWSKYQGDFSTERTRRWRAKKTSHVTLQEERRRRGEEKREDVSPKPPLPLATSTTPGNGTPKPIARSRPGHFDVPDDEIMGPEEFKKMRAQLDPPELERVGTVKDDDIFSGM